MDNYRLGIFYGLGAYLLWGVLPIYWKLLQHVEAMEILASRFLWSAVFVFLLLLATGKLNIFMQETKAIFSTKKTACCMVLAAIMISFNWGIFIWTHCRNKHGLLYQPADECALWCSISA